MPRQGQWAGLLPGLMAFSANGAPEPDCQFKWTQLSQSTGGHAALLLC